MMFCKSPFPAIAAAPSCAVIRARAQGLPEGPGKETVAAVCGGCHGINVIRGGCTPEGWRTVVRMMQNAGAPAPPDQ
jgi:virginiamycin B lyase